MGGWGFCVTLNAFFSKQLSPRITATGIKGSNSRNFVSMAIKFHRAIEYSTMTDNLKRAGIFRKSVYFFFMVSVLDFYISNTQSFC